MEIIPDLRHYPISYNAPLQWRSIRNLEIYKFIRKLEDKLPNEYKHALKQYNHLNKAQICCYSDENEYYLQ